MQDQSTHLLAALHGVDLRSADGRAGIATALAEIERNEPGTLLRVQSRCDLPSAFKRSQS